MSKLEKKITDGMFIVGLLLVNLYIIFTPIFKRNIDTYDVKLLDDRKIYREDIIRNLQKANKIKTEEDEKYYLDKIKILYNGTK